jgi:methylated-DNA-protein-cysteine methyltransferase related protein
MIGTSNWNAKSKKNNPLAEQRDYFEDVYAVVRLIPAGRVTSYGAIARYLSLRAGARMVGWAMNSSHGHDVPAHRVVNRIGVLSGKHFFGSPTAMQELLEQEGIPVQNDQIQDFDRFFWDPSTELL